MYDRITNVEIPERMKALVAWKFGSDGRERKAGIIYDANEGIIYEPKKIWHD